MLGESKCGCCLLVSGGGEQVINCLRGSCGPRGEGLGRCGRTLGDWECSSCWDLRNSGEDDGGRGSEHGDGGNDSGDEGCEGLDAGGCD